MKEQETITNDLKQIREHQFDALEGLKKLSLTIEPQYADLFREYDASSTVLAFCKLIEGVDKIDQAMLACVEHDDIDIRLLTDDFINELIQLLDKFKPEKKIFKPNGSYTYDHDKYQWIEDIITNQKKNTTTIER